MERRGYLDFCAQAGKVLNSTGNRLIKINMILTMLIENYSIRNPILVVRDSVTNEYSIELAPELEQQERDSVNKSLNGYIARFPCRFNYELILSPEEAVDFPFILPDRLKGKYDVFVSYPIVGQDKSFNLGILVAFIEKDMAREKMASLNIIASMIGLYLDSQDKNIQDIYEPPLESAPTPLEGIVGASPAIQKIAELVRKISTSRASVFIRGESGTGKELIARAIHKYSLRSRAPFISVNCAALPDTLLESELFGHEKGAFTGAVSVKKGRFELANGGTFFLDEIGDTSLGFQTKLLRVLQEGEFERLGSTKTIKVDVRIVCSTHVDIEGAIRDETFREDLYYRLNVIPVWVPPLRERREDVPLLANYFLMRLNQEHGKSVRISNEGMRLLQGRDWPGNVRELQNVLHRAFVMEHGGLIGVESLTETARGAVSRPVAAQAPLQTEKRPKEPSASSDLRNEEVRAIESALRESRGVQSKAARLLGISLRQLRYRINKYDLKVRKIWLT